MKSVKIIICVTLILFISCKENEIVYQSESEQIITAQWRLITIDTGYNGLITLDPADTIFLVFEKPKVVHGICYGRCGNYYNAIYTLGNSNSIKIDSIISTEALCPESRYWDYIYRLNKVNSYRLNGDELYLYFNNNAQRLVFKKSS